MLCVVASERAQKQFTLRATMAQTYSTALSLLNKFDTINGKRQDLF